MAEGPYNIQYAHEAAKDLHVLRAFDRKAMLDAIEQQLGTEPTRTSRSRIKQMRQPFWSQYRLRVADFRVYYDVQVEQRTVYVLRVLEKGQGKTPEKPT
jgi:mRNA-degrading endonuclease RelE of RelBE toxin-antitoxin system